jgi:ATP-dependent Lhr-like helicase
VSRYWRDAVENDALTILYIAPTKALVNDLEKRLAAPLASLGLRLAVRHGDHDGLAAGSRPHLLITTPESLDVLLFRKDEALRTLRAVVIDEVHLLYNTQRGLQLSILLRRLGQLLEQELQWAALSATVGDLDHVREFLVGAGKKAASLSFPAQRAIDAVIRHVKGEAQFVALARKLTEGRPTKLLVFANSRRECEILAGALVGDPSLHNSVFAHYSSLSPEMRLDTERKFASMGTAICVATSTLELGIDIGDIDAVLLWGAPLGVESFLQRIGRGNRRSSKTNVVGLIPSDSESVVLEALRFCALVDAGAKGAMPLRAPYDLFGAAGQQCLSVIASDGGAFKRVSDLCAVMNHKPSLDRPTVELILAELEVKELVQHHGFKNRYGAQENLHRLVDYRMIYGNFGVGSETVSISHGSMRLGEVPAVNLLRVRRGITVRFAGKYWEVLKFSRDGIQVQPGRKSTDALDFSYGGKRGHGDPFVINRMWSLAHAREFTGAILSTELRTRVIKYIDRLRGTCSPDQVPFRHTSDGFLYFTFAGYTVNKALGLASEAKNFVADDFALLLPSRIDWPSVSELPEDYEKWFHLLFEATSDQSTYQKCLPLELQLRECLQSWLKDETMRSTLRRLSKAQSVQVDWDLVSAAG